MEISKLHEIFVVCGCFMCGAVLGFIFDIFRSVRKCFKFKDKTVAMQDLGYWIIALAVIYTAVYYLNFAEIRIYQFLFMIFGSYIYIKLLSRYAGNILCKIIMLLCRFLKFLTGTLCVPFKLIYKIVKKLILSPLRAFFGIIYRKLTKTTHKIKKITSKFCKRFQKS